MKMKRVSKRVKLIAIALVLLVLVSIFATACNKEDEKRDYRQEMEALVGDKNPDDIVITDEMTEEERAVTEEEKKYWQVVTLLKEKVKKMDGSNSDNYVTAGIKDIFAEVAERQIENDRVDVVYLMFYAYTYRRVGVHFIGNNGNYVGEYERTLQVYSIWTTEIPPEKLTIDDVIEFLTKYGNTIQRGYDYKCDEQPILPETNEVIDLLRNYDDILDGATSYVVMSNSHVAEKKNDLPYRIGGLVKCYKDDEPPYYAHFDVQVQKWAQEEGICRECYRTGNIYFVNNDVYAYLGFDWQVLNDKYKLNNFFGEDDAK